MGRACSAGNARNHYCMHRPLADGETPANGDRVGNERVFVPPDILVFYGGIRAATDISPGRLAPVSARFGGVQEPGVTGLARGALEPRRATRDYGELKMMGLSKRRDCTAPPAR